MSHSSIAPYSGALLAWIDLCALSPARILVHHWLTLGPLPTQHRANTPFSPTNHIVLHIAMDQNDYDWKSFINWDACAPPLSAGFEAVGEAAS